VEPFVLTPPRKGPVPVLVEVPHAGLSLPAELERVARARPEDALRDADPFVDRLVKDAPDHGAALLCARLSRYVVDLNRAPDDVSREVVPDHPAPKPTQARGVVWATTTEGRLLWPKPLAHTELARRLEHYHAPYHRVIEDELSAIRQRHGWALLLSVHSMPSSARGARRADVVPGTRGRTTAAAVLIDAVDAHFKGKGLGVRHDDPYRGGYTTGLWGRPADQIHAIQIEISRALYLDERTLTPQEAGVAAVGELMMGLVDRLGALDPR
jgi:N-formylglutamate amidohydrolase